MSGNNSDSVLHRMSRKEIDPKSCLSLRRTLHVTRNLIGRLSLEGELDGHTGCVNCLEWDSSGRNLVSASDDFNVILWDPFRHRKLQTVQTGHHGNIFSVKYLPGSKDETLITGAGDNEIRVHNLVCKETTRVCTCHTARVKRLATAPYSDNDVFWSASEDGIIRQHDMRIPHACQKNESTVLVDLTSYSGDFCEAKCLAVNPLKPELIAVGANDPYIRLYDRRMIKLVKGPGGRGNGCTEDNIPPNCVQYFVPGHIAACKRKPTERDVHEYSTTYLVFGPDGNELLANLGSEQIYLFDINTGRTSLLVHHVHDGGVIAEPIKGLLNGFDPAASTFLSEKNQPHLPDKILSLKATGNKLFERKKYAKSIRLYNEAIADYPDSSVIYSNRAAAFLKREWHGDSYAALRDCITALNYDPNNMKAFFRLTRCLFNLGWYEVARLSLDQFKSVHPNQAHVDPCRALEQDIIDKLDPTADSVEDGELEFIPMIHYKEYNWREKSKDYDLRYYGHCNTTTDIKEANFFGGNGQYIVAGSDDGSIFIWDRKTTNNIRILKGDSSIVNCVQPHPTYCLLATSGIEHKIRLWSPRPDDGHQNALEVAEQDEVAESNQRRMLEDPFDVVLTNMGLFRADDDEDEENDSFPAIGCRPS